MQTGPLPETLYHSLSPLICAVNSPLLIEVFFEVSVCDIMELFRQIRIRNTIVKVECLSRISFFICAFNFKCRGDIGKPMIRDSIMEKLLLKKVRRCIRGRH